MWILRLSAWIVKQNLKLTQRFQSLSLTGAAHYLTTFKSGWSKLYLMLYAISNKEYYDKNNPPFWFCLTYNFVNLLV